MSNLAELEKMMAKRALKQTRIRRSILRGLLEKGDWTTARDIYEYVKTRQKVDFSTIYRNLDTLTATGILCRVERQDAVSYYTINHHEGHHHHLICKSCQKVVLLDYCPLQAIDPQILENFSNVECKFDLYGFCRECQEQNRNTNAK